LVKKTTNSEHTNATSTNASQPRKILRRRSFGLVAILALGAAWYHHVANNKSPGDRRHSRRSVLTSKNIAKNSVQAVDENDSKTSKSADMLSDLSQPSIANAQALIDNGLIQEGSTMLEKLIDQDPGNTQALMEMALVYTLDLKEPEKSRHILERIIDINPSHRAALNELELLYKELGAVDDGLALLELKSEQYPESLEIQYVYGRLLAISDPEAAIPWLERATQIGDQKEQALDQLAATALRSGQIGLAVKSWTEALALAENELEQAKANGESGLDYLEDRISATKIELAKAQQQLSGSRESRSARQ